MNAELVGDRRERADAILGGGMGREQAVAAAEARNDVEGSRRRVAGEDGAWNSRRAFGELGECRGEGPWIAADLGPATVCAIFSGAADRELDDHRREGRDDHPPQEGG